MKLSRSDAGDVITSRCPLACRCGCRPSEICGDDGRCYCPDGSLVVPLIDENDRLTDYNQTCPPGPANGKNRKADRRSHSTLFHDGPVLPPLSRPTSSLLPPSSLSPPSPASSSPAPSAALTASLVSSVALLAVASSLLALFLLRLRRRRRKAKESHRENNNLPMRLASGRDSQLVRNELYESAQLLSTETLQLLGAKSIQPDRINLLWPIGQGNFGIVYKG